MKKTKIVFVFVLALCLNSGFVFGSLDSLQRLLNKHNTTLIGIKDTTRINILIEMGVYYQYVNPDSALYFHQQAADLADKILDEFNQMTENQIAIIELKKALSFREMGWDYLVKGDYELAHQFLSAGILITEKYISPPTHPIIQQKANYLYSAMLGNKGSVYRNQGNFAKSLECSFKALEIDEETGDLVGQAKTIGNIGSVYVSQGDYPKALEYYYKALKMDEQTGNTSGQAANLGNMGVVYNNQQEYDKALECFFRALELKIEVDDLIGQAINLGNIGIVYHRLGNTEKALDYYLQALALDQQLGRKSGEAVGLGNLGVIYRDKDQNEKALSYYFQALKICEEIGELETVITNLGNIGDLYTSMKNYQEAERYLTKALKLSIEIGSLDALKITYKQLSNLYEATDRPGLALENYKLHIVYRDSLFNEENTKASLQKEIQFEYEKQAAADSVAFEKEQELANAELAMNKIEIEKNNADLRAKRNQQYALFGGLILVIVFAGFMYNRFTVTKKQKQIIELQKTEVEKQKEYAEEQQHLVEEKNKEITDSINYAKRIQAAILPPNRIVKKHLPDSFILYKPKDIVAGDFYWLEVSRQSAIGSEQSVNSENSFVKNKLRTAAADCILFAAADCTGHGVPGAMVSVVCNNALNRSVREYNLSEPGKILDKTREIVIQEFEKSDHEVKDGMDISLCSLSFSSLTLQWSGANNPLWIIRASPSPVERGPGGEVWGNEIIEIKPDKQPIGKYAEAKPFTTHQIELQKGDSIYVFTDGFQDQFGGEKGKKFKASSMKELLLSIQDKTMEQQKEILTKSFESWRGSLEQIDDVCVIGFRL